MEINAKTTAAIITIVLMMTLMAAVAIAQDEAPIIHGGEKMVGVPDLGPLPAGATPDQTYDSMAFLSFRPNPIGVGQTLLVNVWTSPGMYHAFYMQGYTVYIEKPDGTTTTVGPFDSFMGDASGWFEYVPTTPGTYKLKFESPGTYIPRGIYVDSPTGQAYMTAGGNYTLYQNLYYKPDSTDWQELTVQADMIASYPPAPLPTDYWTRPVYPDKREWYPITGNYPFSGKVYYANGRELYASGYQYTAYVKAPNTAHVAWRRQGNIAGLIGGEQYQYSLSAGAGTPNIIYAGRCYQTVNKLMSSLTNGTYYDQPVSVWRCYDLRTGQVYWDNTIVNAAPTNIIYEKSSSEPVPGAEASQGYSVSLVGISGNRLYKFNPWTGAVSLNISLPTLSNTIYNNEYVLGVQNMGGGVYRLINWTMLGTSTNFTTRIQPKAGIQYGWNISWPRGSLGLADYDAGIAATVGWATPPGGHWCIGYDIQSVDIQTGQVLWYKTENNTSTMNVQNPTASLVNRGKIAFGAHENVWTCFDGRSGTKLWTSEQTLYPWGSWWPYNRASYDFNESKSAIITSTYEGVYAIDWDNGKILWHYTDPNVVPFEDPYDATPFFTGVQIADGKIYAYNGEHTPSQPLTRAWSIHCINANTGEFLWKMTGPMTPGAIADGYLTASNSYDGYMYVFGRGKSATTVTAPDTAVPKGTGVMIKGTVLDESPGDQGSIQNPTARLDSAKNVPCVSKDSMTTQMEYLYIGHPIDGIWHNETLTGVPVTLTAIGSDGSVIDLGTTTTNGYYGTFSYTWQPTSEGDYTVMASFAGDDSYGSSTAATAVSVGPAPAPIDFPEAPTPVDNTMLLYGILVAVAIAIVLALIAILAIFRKK